MTRDEENRLLEIAARWEAVCGALEGKEPSDFMQSFPEVRRAYDLYYTVEYFMAADGTRSKTNDE